MYGITSCREGVAVGAVVRRVDLVRVAERPGAVEHDLHEPRIGSQSRPSVYREPKPPMSTSSAYFLSGSLSKFGGSTTPTR